jgi:hypothetical protein
MLVQSYAYPTTKELIQIEQAKLPALTANSPIFRYFPFEGKDSHLLEWEQEDNWGGMQQIRGLNGMPPRVAAVGAKSFIAKPGVYGERMDLDEMEMTLRARNRRELSTSISIGDLVMKRQDQLLDRRLVRIEWLCWQLFLYGRFIVHDLNNVILHKAAYATQEYTAPISWSNAGSSKPLQDLRNISLMSRGQSTAFDQRATLLMNRVTANLLMANTNDADLGKKLSAGLQPVTSINGVNAIFTGENLPNIEIYDEGYLDEEGNNVTWIPDNVVMVVGVRTNGAALGRFRFTMNINNPGSEPTPYVRVLDHFDRRIPRLIEVHDGFNGGPILFFPGSIVRVNV